MTLKPAYVVGGALEDGFLFEVSTGKRPRLEFLIFSRNGGTLYSADIPPKRPGRIGRFLIKRKLPYAWHVASQAKNASALVASGEDIGIPLALALWMRRCQTPLLIQIHGHYIGGRQFAVAAAMLKRMAHVHVLCLSSALRDRLVDTYGFSDARCHSIGYGVDTKFFAPTETLTLPETPLIVAAGLANRDYDSLVEAVRDLDVNLRVAADSPWHTEGQIEKRDLPANVEFRSAGNYLNLRDLYSRACCVVVPMHPAAHACGYAVMAEAMAMGKPVIATRLEAPCDFFEDGVHGIYVDPGDVAGLRAAIVRLVTTPSLATRMGQAARGRMEVNYSLDAVCDRIEKYLP